MPSLDEEATRWGVRVEWATPHTLHIFSVSFFLISFLMVLFPSWEGGMPPEWWRLEDLQCGDWALGLNPGEAGGSL